MKKSLIALAVLAASGTAMAQSSVTLFGVVDAAVTRVSGSNNGYRVGLSQGGESASRLGFRGVEDLGGGLAASFWLEGTVGTDNGGGYSFDRRSTVSLSGNFGEIRLGRDYAPTYWNYSQFDAFGDRGVGRGLGYNYFAGSSMVRNNNAISYLLPSTIGGVYGQIQYAFGEQSSLAQYDKRGDYLGARLGFSNGPLNVAGALGAYKNVIGVTPAYPGGYDLRVANLGASYDFGFVKPMFLIGQENVRNGVGANKRNSYELGATAALGPGVLRASIARYDLKGSNQDANKFAIGYGYNLSKRTQVYTTLAYLKNKNGSNYAVAGVPIDPNGAPAGLAYVGSNNKATGLDIGLRHSF